ncbi:MAG: hypothetical protein JO358_20080 [Alphaproteobacteria bacterium]|nr:hypothetical protein [Alphaproteobacteria bacterium]
MAKLRAALVARAGGRLELVPGLYSAPPHAAPSRSDTVQSFHHALLSTEV